MQKRLLIALFIAGVASVAFTGIAAAQPADAPYRSAMRSQCEDELARDADWRADIKLRLAPDIHAEDAQQMLTNRRHVVMAYAALWTLLAGFVVFMWMRQRGLRDQIARLEREIEQATKDA